MFYLFGDVEGFSYFWVCPIKFIDSDMNNVFNIVEPLFENYKTKFEKFFIQKKYYESSFKHFLHLTNGFMPGIIKLFSKK